MLDYTQCFLLAVANAAILQKRSNSLLLAHLLFYLLYLISSSYMHSSSIEPNHPLKALNHTNCHTSTNIHTNTHTYQHSHPNSHTPHQPPTVQSSNNPPTHLILSHLNSWLPSKESRAGMLSASWLSSDQRPDD
jgi:ABC-type nickel/cobalt efflux system permease component RcnA